MGSVIRFFIQNPVVLFLIAGAFVGAYFLGRNLKFISQPRHLLFPAAAFALWGVWELVIKVFTPEANIRVDLLLVISAVLIAVGYGVIRSIIAR